MSELVVVAQFHYKQDRLDEALEALKELAQETHTKEDENLLYSFHQDQDDPCSIVVIERWTGPEALDAHMQTPHIQKIGALLPDLIDAPPVMWKLDPLGYGTAGKGRIS
jgi:quinol monooxygenase YgiN